MKRDAAKMKQQSNQIVPSTPLNVTSTEQVGFTGPNLLVAIISKNLIQSKGHSCFESKTGRDLKQSASDATPNQKRLLQTRMPEHGNYECVDLKQNRVKTVNFNSTISRKNWRIPHDWQVEYRNQLNLGDYSSFKTRDFADFQFDNLVERDQVSFLKDVARFDAAKRHGLSLQEYTKRLLEFKTGKVNHAMFQNKINRDRN